MVMGEMQQLESHPKTPSIQLGLVFVVIVVFILDFAQNFLHSTVVSVILYSRVKPCQGFASRRLLRGSQHIIICVQNLTARGSRVRSQA